MDSKRNTRDRARKGLWALAVVLICSTLPGTEARSADLPLREDLQVAITLKILSYDRALTKRCAKGLSVGVVARPGTADSAAQAKALEKAYRDNAGMRVKGLAISAVTVTTADVAELEARALASRLCALHVTSGWSDAELGTLSTWAAQHQVVLLTAVPTHIGHGPACAVVQRAAKPKILIDLPAAKQQGLDLESALLRLADVRR